MGNDKKPGPKKPKGDPKKPPVPRTVIVYTDPPRPNFLKDMIVKRAENRP